MQVVFHIGAHCTGRDRLIRSLLKNREMLAREGVAVPGPGRYRRTIDEAIRILRGAPATEDAQDVLLEAVLDAEDAERIVLSNENFICKPRRVLEHGQLYPRIGKTAWLRNAFPQAEVGFAIALRNMATFLPALHDLLGGAEGGPPDLLAGTDPRELMWADVIEGIAEANPGASILVWCDEDTPLLWPEIMREICGLDALQPLEGANDMARHLLSAEGQARLAAALRDAAPETEIRRREIVGETLEQFADDGETVQEISLPGWTDDLIDDLTDFYEDDVATIARIPGVTLLAP